MVIQPLWNEAGRQMQRAGMMCHYMQTISATICENKSTKQVSTQCFFWKTANIFQRSMIILIQYCTFLHFFCSLLLKHLWVGSSDIAPRYVTDILPVKLLTFDSLFLSPIPWTFLSSYDKVSGLFDSVLICKAKMVIIFYLLFWSKPNPGYQSAIFSQQWINFSAL